MFIGEAPGKQETKEGKPFVGYSGKFLRSKLALYEGGDAPRFDNLVHEAPPKYKFDYFKTPEGSPILDKSVAELKALIKEFKPNLILCLGAKPLQHLMGRYNVSDWRGHVVWSEELGCKLMCTYHPTVCMKQRNVHKDSHPGQYETLFMWDVKKAVTESRTHDLTFDKFSLIVKPSYHEASNYLKEAIANANILSYDIETDCVTTMDCISFCYEYDRAISIPFGVMSKDGWRKYWKSDHEAVEIFRLVKELLESEIPKVAQNAQFDTTFLAMYYKITVRNLIWCTMVCAHDLYSELPKGLGTLMSLYANIPYHKDQMGAKRWAYSAADAIANLHVMRGQRKEAEELGVLNHFLTVSHSAIMPCVWMQLEGVRVDEAMREEAIAQEDLLQKEIIEALDEILPVRINTNKKFTHKFNPNSGPDKKVLFSDYLHCKLHYNKGSLTFNAKTMDTYMEDDREYVRLLAKAVKTYRLSVTMRGKLVTPLLNGRMHSAYDVTGTDTGRLNSSASIFRVIEEGVIYDCGTNLQNLQKGVQRSMLIPDEGEGFEYLDLWAAEAFPTALDAQEVGLLKMLNNGEKIHSWMLAETSKKFPKEVEKAGYEYKNAKQSVHLLNYGGGASAIARESGLPMYVCEWQYNFYHNKFPGIKMRQDRIKNELLSGRTITSLLGRKKVVLAPMSDDLLKQAYAWPNQSVIGELTILGMVKLHYVGRCPSFVWCFPALNTHDGLAVRYKLGDEKAVKEITIDAFDIPLKKDNLEVRIPLEVGWAENFNDVNVEEIVRYDY